MVPKRVLLPVILAYCVIVCAADNESVTESSTVSDNEASTGPSIPKRSRSLEVEDNSLDDEARRNPRFGFAVPFPNIPGMGGDQNTTPGPNPDTHVFGGPGDLSGSASLGTTAVLIKGGILSGLMALKAAVLPPIFLGALILFLIAGAGFFSCSIVNCNRLIGNLAGPAVSPNFGGPPYNPFNRNGIDEYEQQRPALIGIDDTYKKYH